MPAPQYRGFLERSQTNFPPFSLLRCQEMDKVKWGEGIMPRDHWRGEGRAGGFATGQGRGVSAVPGSNPTLLSPTRPLRVPTLLRETVFWSKV